MSRFTMKLARPELAPHINNTLAMDWSIADVAKALKVSDNHIRNMVKRGEIASYRVGGRVVRILGSEIERIRNCRNSSPAASGNNSPLTSGAVLASSTSQGSLASKGIES